MIGISEQGYPARRPCANCSSVTAQGRSVDAGAWYCSWCWEDWGEPANQVGKNISGGTCANCKSVARSGRTGDLGSGFEDQWYCDDCWRQWGVEQSMNTSRGAKCERPGCAFLKHTLMDHGFCCNGCAAGSSHGIACEGRLTAESLNRTDGRCARRGCSFLRHDQQGHAYCCEACGKGESHGPSCMRRHHPAVLMVPSSLSGSGRKCLRVGCVYATHSLANHGYCCEFCQGDKAHGLDCEQRCHVALEDFSVRALRDLCKRSGISVGRSAGIADEVDIQSKRVPSETTRDIPTRIGSSFCKEGPDENAGVLGWRTEASDANPFDSREYHVPMMSEVELSSISVALEDVEDRLMDVLDEHGCAVVTGVVSISECEHLESLFKRDLESLLDTESLESAPESVKCAYHRFIKEGPRSFPKASAEKLTVSAGFALYRCLMQGRFAWQIRGHPNVHRCFRAAFPDEGGNLVTSMDVTFFTPEGAAPRMSNSFSAHVDQNSHDVREGLAECSIYQGALYVWGADEVSSTTAVWAGSHREIYNSLMEDASFSRRGRRGEHYCEFSGMCDRSAARKLAAGWARCARRVPVPAGALLLWSSRLAHTGWTSGPRLAQAVCLEPASRRTEAQRVSKLRLAALGLPSTHWAQVAMQHDMSLSDHGFFGTALKWRAPTKRMGVSDDDVDLDNVVLPFRCALRPASLAEKSDLEALARLVRVPFKYTGMWQPSEDMLDLLEASVTAECKALV